VPVLTYKEGIDLLIASGDDKAKYYADLTTPQEKILGEIVRQKYNTDF